MKVEITEEFKALCLAVIDGSVSPEKEEDLMSDSQAFKMGGLSIYDYPWLSGKQLAQDFIEKEIKIHGYLDGDFYWVHAKVDNQINASLGCTYSISGKKWSKQNYFKFPARVALESLKTRLDRGLV